MLPGTHSFLENFIGPEPTYSVISLNGSVLAIRSGMISASGALPLPSANSIFGKGRFSLIRTVRSSTATISSIVALIRWPIVSRTIHRARLATTSLPRTGSPSWNFNPGRSVNVHSLKSGVTVWPSAICGFGTMLLSMPYSVSHTIRLALRTTYCVPATESSEDRLACGTNRSTRLFCASDRRGAASVPTAAAEPVASKSRRFIRTPIDHGILRFKHVSGQGRPQTFLTFQNSAKPCSTPSRLLRYAVGCRYWPIGI